MNVPLKNNKEVEKIKLLENLRTYLRTHKEGIIKILAGIVMGMFFGGIFGYGLGIKTSKDELTKKVDIYNERIKSLENILDALGFNQSNVVSGIVTNIENNNGTFTISLKPYINSTDIYVYRLPANLTDDFNKSHIDFILQLEASGANRRNPDGSIRGIQYDPTIILIGYKLDNKTLVPITLLHGWYFKEISGQLYPVDPQTPGAKFYITDVYFIDPSDGIIEQPGIPYVIYKHLSNVFREPVPIDVVNNDPIIKDSIKGWEKTLGYIFGNP